MAKNVLKIGGIGVFAFCVIAAIYVFALREGWFVKRTSLDEISRIVEPNLFVTKPEGEGPFPTVLLFHGCGGDMTHQAAWATLFADIGYAAIVVDSYKGRGIVPFESIEPVCSGAMLWGAERAADIVVAMDWARSKPWVNSNDLTLAGWAHGAWAIMDLFALHPPDQNLRGVRPTPNPNLEEIRRVILFYPYCGLASRTSRSGWTAQPDVLAITLRNDSAVGDGVCDNSLKWIDRSGAKVVHHIFDDVDHSFDGDAMSEDDRRVRKHAPQIAEAATQVALQHVYEFLEAEE